MISTVLKGVLQDARNSVLASLDGLSEYDARRPVVPSGTNLLGLVKHLVGIELTYLGESVGRPAPLVLPWVADGSVWEGAHLWARPEETREYLVDLYRTAWRHSDESIVQLPLDAPATVPWWPEDRRDTTFGVMLACVVAETAQHAGHCDILRETIDGWSKAADNGPDFTAKVRAAAEHFRAVELVAGS